MCVSLTSIEVVITAHLALCPENQMQARAETTRLVPRNRYKHLKMGTASAIREEDRKTPLLMKSLN